MYPGGGSDQYPYGEGWPGGQPPQQSYPQQPYPQQPSPQQPYPQQQPYPAQPYPPQQPYPEQQQYPQQQTGYQWPGYQQPGYQQQQPPVAAPPAAPPRSSQTSHVIVVAAVAIVAMISVLGVAIYVVTKSRDSNTAGPDPTGSSTPTTAPTTAGPKRSADPKGGLAVGTGPVRVDIYVDYQCPPCSSFEANTSDLLTGYVSSNRVTLTIHPVAFVDERSKNRYATRAAAAEACAYEAGKGLEFHGYLLTHQPAEDTAGPTDADLVRAGEPLGLGSGFASCVSGGEKVGWVGQATSAAEANGVSSVPALYVNNQSVKANRSDLMAAVANAK
jgi:protein-disulfide isomerase